MCNSGLLSTNTLAATAATVSSLTFYDPINVSSGTFRYSTLTTLLALPNTSVLLFNNFVVAGAYVWPGQTIQSLNWTGGINQCNVGSGGTITVAGAIAASNIFPIFTGLTGGTPPYRIIDVTPGYTGPVVALGAATGYSSRYFADVFCNYNGNPNGAPSTFSTVLTNFTNFSTMLTNGANYWNCFASSNQTAFKTLYAFRLLDSSSPPFSRDIQFNWAL
jgi:hypothetical protein